MTTIATDGITIVGDGMGTRGSCPVDTKIVKIQARHGRIYALSGSSAMTDPIIEWHNAGADPAKKPSGKDANWALIVIDENGIYSLDDDIPFPDKCELPFAIGSGGKWATAAMLLGKTPREAVEFAIKQDVYTGGLITEIDIAMTLAGMKAAQQRRAAIEKAMSNWPHVPPFEGSSQAEALQ